MLYEYRVLNLQVEIVRVDRDAGLVGITPAGLLTGPAGLLMGATGLLTGPLALLMGAPG